MSPRTDPRSDRGHERRLLTLIALGILLLAIGLGGIYLTLWSSAAKDLTRLLPASTRAWASSPSPWAAMTRAASLPIWRDREDLEKRVLATGYLQSESAGDLSGIPVGLVREILRSADGLEVALVPSAGGQTLLLFVDIRDTTQRKRVLSKLKPLLETVDRKVGIRIDTIRRHLWQRLVSVDIEPPRVVELDPWLVFSWGAPIGLDEVLDARVGGRRDALYRRPGFAVTERTGLRLAVDAGSAWTLLADRPEPPPGGLVEFLDLVTISARAADASAQDDPATLTAEVSDRELVAALKRGLAPARHELVALAPDDALFVVSATGDDLAALVDVLRSLVFRLQRDFFPSAEPSALVTTLVAAAADLPPGGGELALVGLPGGDGEPPFEPLLLLRTAAPETAEATLARTLPERLGDGFSRGEVLHRGERLHLAVPHTSAPGEPDRTDGRVLAWRVRRGLVEVAGSVEVLDRFARETRTLGESGRLAPVVRRADGRESALLVVADPRTLDLAKEPLFTLLRSRLKDDVLLSMTLDAVDDRLELRSSVGVWTLLAVLASADRSELDSLLLRGLAPRCREAFDAFCTLYPRAIPCRPLALGRRARIDQVCAALMASP